MAEKDWKALTKLIFTSKGHARRPFFGQNIQQMPFMNVRSLTELYKPSIWCHLKHCFLEKCTEIWLCIFRFSSKIPVTFMIGFYVANVVSRYWDQFISLPWPDRIAYKLVAFIPGQVKQYIVGFFLSQCSAKTLSCDIIFYAVWKLIREY